jgi:ribonuclease T1
MFRLLAALALALAVGACTSAPAARTSTAQARPAATATGLGTINAADLPAEARTTLSLIAQGGPYPFRKDGVSFQNRERLLPREPSGYYREFTVPTPGAGDRGARRIIAGKNGERYYTPDHYRTFLIIEGA